MPRMIVRVLQLVLVFTAVIAGRYLWSWGTFEPHLQIVDAAVNLGFPKGTISHNDWAMRPGGCTL